MKMNSFFVIMITVTICKFRKFKKALQILSIYLIPLKSLLELLRDIHVQIINYIVDAGNQMVLNYRCLSKPHKLSSISDQGSSPQTAKTGPPLPQCWFSDYTALRQH